MTEKQADKIISLLEEISSNTNYTKTAVANLQHIRNLDDLYDELEQIKTSIKNISFE